MTPWCEQSILYKEGDKVEYFACDLRHAVGADVVRRCKRVDRFVHLAWARPQKSSDAFLENRIMFDHIRAVLPKEVQIVYISSVCATADNPSHYGQAKYRLGLHMGGSAHVEVITGLVRSTPAMGPYLALENFVCRLHGAFKFLPSPQALVAHQDQVMESLVQACTHFDDCPSLVKAYDEQALYLNDLIVDILKTKSVWGVPLPVPTHLVVWMLLGARKFFPKISMVDRLITLFTVSPKSLAKRVDEQR